MSEQFDKTIDIFQSIYKDDIHRIDGYNIFADESMNLRKVSIKDSLKNELKHKYFVLGGIEVPTTCNLDNLKEKFVNDNFPTGEVKYKYFSYNNSNFKSVLKSERLNKLFKYMIKNKIYIHISVFNYWYWATADIYDSIIESGEYNYVESVYLKSALYEALMADYDSSFDIFLKYDFPSIPHGSEKNFLLEINKILKNVVNSNKIRNDQLKRNVRELILLFDKKLSDIKELIFIQDEMPKVILKSLSGIYLEKIAHFVYNGITFDRELKIEQEIKLEDDKLIDSRFCKFVDSKDYFAIQISDVIVGFTARFFEFISRNDEIDLYYKSLKSDSIEIENIRLFRLIMDRSARKYQFNYKVIMSMYQNYKLKVFFDTIDAIYY